MHSEQTHQRFRIMLHIHKLLGRGRRGEIPRRLQLESAAARSYLSQGNWLGYETSLFEIAASAIAGLEHHLKAMDAAGRGLRPSAWFPASHDEAPECPWRACACGCHGMEVPCLFMDADLAFRAEDLIEGLVSAILEDEAPAPEEERRGPRAAHAG